MKKLIAILFIFYTSMAYAQLPPPPVMQGQNTQTIQYLQNVYDNHNLLETVNTNPDGIRLGRYGDMIRYKESATSFVIYTCISSPQGKVWTRASDTCHGIPAGGTASQALVKLSNSDYDAGWVTLSIPFTNSVTIIATGSGIWTCPAGVTKVFLTMVGGGGAGGGSANGGVSNYGGGGGSSGGHLINIPYSTIPGNDYPYSVATGGNYYAVADAGVTTFGTGTVLIAGGGGYGLIGSSVPAPYPNGGQCHGAGLSNRGCDTFDAEGGRGGGSIFGKGGDPGVGPTYFGYAPSATAYGAGGGGGKFFGTTNIGGNGADGCILIQW